MKHFNNKKQKNSGFAEIYGIHPVVAALNNKKRKHKKLIISEQNKDLLSREILKNIPEINQISNREMTRLYGSENVHQGLILITTELKQPKIEEILIKSFNKKNEIVVMLDQVTDPKNIGSIIRSCSLFNCKTLIVSKDNAPNITSSLSKSASGSIEVVNYIKVINLSRTIELFKKHKFWVCGLDNNKKISNKNSNRNIVFPKKCLLVVGAEGKGLRLLTKKNCDEIFSIPTVDNNLYKIDSLNVSNACSIALYEYYKKNEI